MNSSAPQQHCQRASGPVGEAAAPAAERPAWHSLRTGFLHVLTLNAFVIAQPLFDRLQRNSGYLAQEQITPAAMAIVTAVLLIGPPLACLALRKLAGLLNPNLSLRAHLSAVFIYLVLAALLVFRAATDGYFAQRLGIPGLLLLGLSCFGAWWLTRQYATVRWLRATASAACVAVVVFPWMFWTSRPVVAALFPEGGPRSAPLRAENPVNVVMIVFDGLAGMALLDESHQLDAVRFPNFARLGRTSSWYRNASTVHPRTDNAVPAMLTGRYPEQEREPSLQQHPDNLFTFLLRTGQYELTAFEPYTRLCPQHLKQRPHASTPSGKAAVVLGTLAAVYVQTTLPIDLPFPRPVIPRAWFRLPDQLDVDRSARTGLMSYSWDGDRDVQIDHFLDCLEPTGRPALRFLHVMLPHYPWCYFPSGKRYVDWITAADFPQGASGIFGEQWGPDPLAPENAWRRYLLQLQYADRQLGRVLDRLESSGQLDGCLMIVTADHGESFLPNHSRRVPSPATLPDLMAVPLFVKLPRQREGRISDRNVELVDVLPTITDVLGLAPPGPLDGESLLDEARPPRLRKTLYFGGKAIVVEGDFPQRFDYVERMVRLFGSASSVEGLPSGSVLSHLVGRPVEELNVDASAPSPLLLQLRWGDRHSLSGPRDPQFLPCLFEGTVEDADAEQSPIVLAISVNGRIAGVTRTLTDPDFAGSFSLLLPESAFDAGNGEVCIFEVRASADGPTLVPCNF